MCPIFSRRGSSSFGIQFTSGSAQVRNSGLRDSGNNYCIFQFVQLFPAYGGSNILCSFPHLNEKQISCFFFKKRSNNFNMPCKTPHGPLCLSVQPNLVSLSPPSFTTPLRATGISSSSEVPGFSHSPEPLHMLFAQPGVFFSMSVPPELQLLQRPFLYPTPLTQIGT